MTERDDDLIPMPRPHHYNFAHQALREWVFADPVGVLRAVAEGYVVDLLQRAWTRLGEELAADDRLPPEGLGCEVRFLNGDRFCVVFRLPPPVLMPEAYFVAAVFNPEGVDRLFTLEYSDPFYCASEEQIAAMRASGVEGPFAVLCEWWQAVRPSASLRFFRTRGNHGG